MSSHDAPGNRTKAAKIQRSVVAAVLSTLICTAAVSAPVSEAATFVRSARALEARLGAWQETLNGMTFGTSSLPNRSLNGSRGQCLEWIPTIRIVIARVNKNPALGQQFSLLSSLTFFDNALLNLSDAMQLAGPMGISIGETPQLRQDEQKVEAIRTEFHRLYSELSAELFLQLRVADETSQPQRGPASHQPGEISGHVDRLDTGKPLASGVVTFESPHGSLSDRLQRTGEDGSYRFEGLAPGNYWVIAYRSGFVGAVHGVGASQNASKGLISVAPGQKRADINFRLSSAPDVVTLSGELLMKVLPRVEFPLVYGPGSFSPDGKQFAFSVAGPQPEQVCVYNLHSRGLKCVAGPAEQRAPESVELNFAVSSHGPGCKPGPGKLRPPEKYKFNYPAWLGSAGRPAEAWPGAPVNTVNYLVWVGDKLYAEADYNGGDLGFLFQLTRGPAAPFPAVAQAFRQEHDDTAGAGIAHFVAGNSRFTVTAWYGQLAMATPDGEDPFTIATGGKELYSFVFDPQRSLVFYPVPGRYYGALVTFDLKTRLYHEAPLPFSEGLKLLDVKRAGDTTLAAYTVDGPCVPKALANDEDPWILPSKPQPTEEPSSVCLATIPAGGTQ